MLHSPLLLSLTRPLSIFWSNSYESSLSLNSPSSARTANTGGAPVLHPLCINLGEEYRPKPWGLGESVSVVVGLRRQMSADK